MCQYLNMRHAQAWLFVLISSCDWQVVEGMPVVWRINNLETVGKDKPVVAVVIEDCGVIELEQPYDVSKRDAPADVSTCCTGTKISF